MARLILDTGVLVDAYRGRLNLARITGTDSAAVPAVVVAEYLRGVLLTPEPFHRTGTARGAHDLIIAATARAADRIVLTTDRRACFDELPGVGFDSRRYEVGRLRQAREGPLAVAGLSVRCAMLSACT